jgi:hypothetical protein
VRSRMERYADRGSSTEIASRGPNRPRRRTCRAHRHEVMIPSRPTPPPFEHGAAPRSSSSLASATPWRGTAPTPPGETSSVADKGHAKSPPTADAGHPRHGEQP